MNKLTLLIFSDERMEYLHLGEYNMHTQVHYITQELTFLDVTLQGDSSTDCINICSCFNCGIALDFIHSSFQEPEKKSLLFAEATSNMEQYLHISTWR